jgi:hypothetical protein
MERRIAPTLREAGVKKFCGHQHGHTHRRIRVWSAYNICSSSIASTSDGIREGAHGGALMTAPLAASSDLCTHQQLNGTFTADAVFTPARSHFPADVDIIDAPGGAAPAAARRLLPAKSHTHWIQRISKEASREKRRSLARDINRVPRVCHFIAQKKLMPLDGHRELYLRYAVVYRAHCPVSKNAPGQSCVIDGPPTSLHAGLRQANTVQCIASASFVNLVHVFNISTINPAVDYTRFLYLDENGSCLHG